MVDYSIRPNESKASVENLRPPGWSPKTQSEFSAELEPLESDIRGLKLAQKKQQKKVEEQKLEQVTIQLGIEQTKTKQKKEQFKAATFQLIAERAKTAKAQDSAVFETKSWDSDQKSVKAKLESIRLQRHNEDETFKNDKRAAVASFN